MKVEFGLTSAVKWDRKTDGTHVYVKFFAPLVFRDPNTGNADLEKYAADCRQRLHRVAAEQSVEILVWSIDLDWEDELTVITHHVYARGLLPGATPNRIARALKPARGYATLDLLEQALKQDLPVDPLLKRAVESQRLQRYDRKKKPLAASLTTHILALALTGSDSRAGILLRPQRCSLALARRSHAVHSLARGDSESVWRQESGRDRDGPRIAKADRAFPSPHFKSHRTRRGRL
jgi:hypothetical protein